MTAKSTVIKGRGGKFGRRAAKAVGLTSGGPRRVRYPGLSGTNNHRGFNFCAYMYMVKP
jgi:hypothetical protein